MRLMNIAGLLSILTILLCPHASVCAADENSGADDASENAENSNSEARQESFAAAAPETEPESEKTEEAYDDTVQPSSLVTDFGAKDDDGGQPASESVRSADSQPEDAETERSPDGASEEAQPVNASEDEKTEKSKTGDFPKSPYPEMEGLSDRNFKLGTDENKDAEGDESAEKKIRRHTGFYLRLAPALAYVSYNGKGQAAAEKLDNPKAQGVAGLLDVFVGGAVVEDWILHAVLSITAPFADVKGVEHRKQVNTIGIGLGFTHYFMPQNLYMSANASYAQTKMMKNSDGQVQGFDTSNGFKVNAAFGKEWWVADQFGLGVSGTVFYSWCKKDVLTWNIYGAGAVFTLTYN